MARGSLMAGLAAAVALLATLGVFAARGAPPVGDPYARPGQLVSLPDHRKLNFRCAGRGAPTVLLESGYNAGSNAWGKVVPRIAPVTRVCAYDRAGYGFSDPGPMPRDGAAIARDLDYGLQAANISGPFVVVGHSAGGLYARLFAARRPKDVVGLVFVDSSVSHQTQRFELLFGPNAGSLAGTRAQAQRCLDAVSGPPKTVDDPAVASCAPPILDAPARQAALRPLTWQTRLSELDTLFTSTSDEVDRVGDLLQDIPAIVLTAAKGDGDAGVATDPGGRAWQEFHRQLASGFHPSEQRFVKSSHLIMIERPEVVADAALQLVQAARKPAPPHAR
ncbi:alpha/beta hydrolase [Phenylobacterium sp.]|uniref:alpha/beta hydrolase n=1 Tax=Phenylobacterium sp. TaxID=1871053 RepID=UPI0025E210F4|nr:alpha/beta hydrolase [Phenylobacterium sp.]